MSEGETKPNAYDRGVKLLSRRTHFRAQLADKLGKRGYEEAEIEEALVRLERHGYLDDRRATREYAEGKLAKGPLGRRRLMSDLVRRGAPQDVAGEVLDELLPDDDRAATRAAADAWLARRRGGVKPASLAQHLERRGFTASSIWSVLEELELLAGGAD